MNRSLLIEQNEALRLHDVAHQLQDATLHEMAARVLLLVGLTHVNTNDALDLPEKQKGLWDELPGAICVSADAASVIGRAVRGDGKAMLVSESPDIVMTLEDNIPKKTASVMQGESYHFQDRLPAYELWLIRKEEGVLHKSDSRFTVGQWIETADYFRKSGAYLFPVVAQKLPETYTLLQVHKDGEEVRIYDRHGKEPAGLADIIDVFVAAEEPDNAIFECWLSDGKLTIFDILHHNDRDCTGISYIERQKLLGADARHLIPFVEGVVYTRLENSDDLVLLEAGKYLIRSIYDTVDDLKRPFWFVYEARIVRPGQPLPWLSSGEKLSIAYDSLSDRLKDWPLSMPVPQGIAAQLHKADSRIFVFLDKGGRDRSHSFPQLVEACQKLEEDCIIECVLECSTAEGVPISRSRIQSPNTDASEWDVVAHCYDIPYWAEEDLTGERIRRRVRILDEVLSALNTSLLISAHKAEKAGQMFWCWPADAIRPIDSVVDNARSELQVA